MTIADRISSMLLSVAVCLLPRARGAWGEAMRAEAACLRDGQKLIWAGGCFGAALAERARDRRTLHAVLLPLLLAAFVYLDWHTEEAVVSVAALIALSSALAFLCPQRVVVTAIVAGAVPIAAHAIVNFTWVWVPYYQHKPLEPWEWLVIASLILPATTGAALGSLVRRLAYAERV